MQRRTQPNSLVTSRAHRHPIRVLMTADCMGGVWTYALDLARGLAEENVEVVLATMGDLPTPAQRVQAQQIPGLTLCASRLKLEWMPDCWKDVERAGDWLLELEAQFSPDVIHLNGYAHAMLSWQAPILVVAHSCVLSWWEAVHNCPAPPEWEPYQAAVACGLQSADCVVAPTHAMLRALVRHYGSLACADVIPNGRQPGLYAAQAKEPFILTAGRLWDEAKNMAALVRVAPKLDWPVYVAGSQRHPADNDAASCEAVTALGVPDDNFRLLGSLSAEDLARWYSRASLYALPARYEPFGLSALEAGLSGCALVLGDTDSLREVWGDAVVYAPSEDCDALRHALSALISSPNYRQDMADRAYRQAQRYSLAAMTNAYLDIYGQLMSEYASGSVGFGNSLFPTEADIEATIEAAIASDVESEEIEPEETAP